MVAHMVPLAEPWYKQEHQHERKQEKKHKQSPEALISSSDNSKRNWANPAEQSHEKNSLKSIKHEFELWLHERLWRWFSAVEMNETLRRQTPTFINQRITGTMSSRATCDVQQVPSKKNARNLQEEIDKIKNKSYIRRWPEVFTHIFQNQSTISTGRRGCCWGVGRRTK